MEAKETVFTANHKHLTLQDCKIFKPEKTKIVEKDIQDQALEEEHKIVGYFFKRKPKIL